MSTRESQALTVARARALVITSARLWAPDATDRRCRVCDSHVCRWYTELALLEALRILDQAEREAADGPELPQDEIPTRPDWQPGRILPK